MKKEELIKRIQSRLENNDPLIFKLSKEQFDELSNDLSKYSIAGERVYAKNEAPDNLHSYRFLGQEIHVYVI